MKKTVDEVNIALQEASNGDMEDVIEDPVPINFTGSEPDVEGWDEFTGRVLKEDPPEEAEEDLEEYMAQVIRQVRADRAKSKEEVE